MWIDGLAERAVLAAVELGRGEGRDRAARRRLAPGGFDVVDRERDVVDAVAVLADVLGDLAVRGQRRGEHEPDVVLDHDVARPVADLGLEAAERDRGEAPQRAVVGRGLAGVADPELDVVDAVERQEVGRLGVGVRCRSGRRPGWRRRSRSSPSSRISPAAAGRSARSRGSRGRWLWPPMLRRGVPHWRHGDDLLEHDSTAAAGLARRLAPARSRRRAVAARRALRRRARGSLGAARGARPRRGDARRTGWARSSGSSTATSEPGAVRAGRDRPDPHRPSSTATGRCRCASCSPGSTRAARWSIDAGADADRRRSGRGAGCTRRGRDERRADAAERVRRRPPRGARSTSSRDLCRAATRRLERRRARRACSSSTRSRSGSSVGYLLGGRLDRLAELRLRWAPLALLGLAVQIALFSEPTRRSAVGERGAGVYVASTAAGLRRGPAQPRDPGRGGHRGRRRRATSRRSSRTAARCRPTRRDRRRSAGVAERATRTASSSRTRSSSR